MKLDDLVKKYMDYFENNMSDVLVDYVLMSWFIGQDKKRQKKFDELRKELRIE